MSSRNVSPLVSNAVEVAPAPAGSAFARRALRLGVVAMVALYCAAAWSAIGWVAGAAFR